MSKLEQAGERSTASPEQRSRAPRSMTSSNDEPIRSVGTTPPMSFTMSGAASPYAITAFTVRRSSCSSRVYGSPLWRPPSSSTVGCCMPRSATSVELTFVDFESLIQRTPSYSPASSMRCGRARNVRSASARRARASSASRAADRRPSRRAARTAHWRRCDRRAAGAPIATRLTCRAPRGGPVRDRTTRRHRGARWRPDTCRRAAATRAAYRQPPRARRLHRRLHAAALRASARRAASRHRRRH